MTACAIDWPAFGLEHPGDIGCVGVPVAEVSQACVHEHVAVARVCWACLAELVAYDDLEEWTCGPCTALGHACDAPLQVRELATGGAS